MPLDNCKRCGRLFQKTHSNLCNGCFSYEKNQNMEIYRYVQDNPGVTVEEISKKFNTPVQEVESLVFSGVLGTANQLIRSVCAMCKCEMTYVNRIGYFCYACNNFVEKEGGVGKYTESNRRLDNIKSGKSAFYKPDPNEKRREAMESNSKSSSNSGRVMRAKFGFKRISDAR